MRRVVNADNLALVLPGVVTVLLLVLAVQKQSALSQPPAPVPAAAPTQPSVAFIGDSSTSGTLDGGLGPTNWTALLAARNGWYVTNAAAESAGYVAAPPDGGPLSTQVARVVAARPALVVVAGARPDVAVDPADVSVAADALYGDLRTQLP